MKKLSKQELVDAINALPGDKVTTRPKKSILEEIYQERLEDQAVAAARQVEDDMDEVCCDMADCDCGPEPKNDELGATGRIALVAIVVGGLAGILYLFT